MILLSKSPAETTKFALNCARKLKGGEILCLIGDLGGGKTYFTKGLARGLGIKKLITSPSFLLMKVYKIKKGEIKNFCHVDVYRINNPKEIFDLGLKNFLNRQDTVVVIEWADKIKSILKPYKKIVLKLQFIDKNTRLINIRKSRAFKKSGVKF